MTSTPSVIQVFVHQLMSDAGLDSLDADFREDYAEKLTHQVERHIGIKSVELLDDEGKAAYVEFMQKHEKKEPTPEEVVEFFRSHVDDFDGNMKNVLAEFAQDFLLSMKK